VSTKDVIAEVNWTEKYRPKKLEDLALADDTRAVITAYLEAGSVPHLLFIGPAGSGKTTVARIIIRKLDCQSLNLNASSDRGIDVVRERIGSFVTAMTGARWNIVFLDEADAMTSDAQTAMRNLIESYADRARFILTANYGHKIIAPIQSRCQLLVFERPPLKERWRILSAVLEAEGIEAEPLVVMGYAEKFPDMRQMLWAAQRAFLAKGMLPPAQEAGGPPGTQILQWVEEKNWTALRRLTASGDFDAQQALRELFHAIPDEHRKCGELRHIIGRGVHETGFTPDPIVLFLAVVAGATEVIK
jgi:hypothetical protein